MRMFVIGLATLIAACAPTAALPSASPTSAAASASATPTASAMPAPTESAVGTPVGQPQQPDARVSPTVRVSPGVFPIMTTLRTKLAVVDEQVLNAARWGVERYLTSIDQYRDGSSPALPITGPFLAAVSAALKDSAMPGVKRHFEIESLTIDHHVQKPWGTHAYVDATVGIVDRAVDGSAPDQRETGKLRLTGDKLFVTDGWDFENGRWFNGFAPLPLEQVRTGVAEAVAQYLSLESWTPGTPVQQWGIEGVFGRERAARVAAIDTRQITARFFESPAATIESFETIDGIWSGIATVRIDATLVTTNAAGRTDRASFARHLRVFLLGNWMPQVVDEQTSSGAWVSGGELALDLVDQNRA